MARTAVRLASTEPSDSNISYFINISYFMARTAVRLATTEPSDSFALMPISLRSRPMVVMYPFHIRCSLCEYAMWAALK